MNSVGDIEFRCSRWIEVMHMLRIAHNAFTVSNMKVTRYFIYFHFPANSAAFSSIHCSEMVGTVMDALSGIS